MSIKARALTKYYIKQFIINDNSFQEWATNNFEDLIKEDAIIGYLFATKPNQFGQVTQIFNVYLIKRKYYDNKDEVTLDMLRDAWELFLLKSKVNIHTNVFKNPPIKYWLDTKDNWCKKIATEISNTFKWTYSDSLSEVYLTVMKCYNKPNVYMGNLGYIRKSVINNVLMALRFNKNRLNLDNVNVCSLDISIGSDNEGKEILLSDIIPAEIVETEDSLEYQNLLGCAKKLLRESFSEREIEQILTQKAGYLPMNLYRRLNSWRSKHSPEELYEL